MVIGSTEGIDFVRSDVEFLKFNEGRLSYLQVAARFDRNTDRAYASTDHTLGNNVETLTLIGMADISGTGNNLANTINGNSGNNVLNGAWGDDTLFGGAGDDRFTDENGADRMIGGTGNDTYTVDDAGDVIVENAGEGTDHVNASISFALRDHGQHLETLTLTGSSDINGSGNRQANIIIGNTGNNVLNGGLGEDTLFGGTGDDIYIVDHAGGVIVENAAEGTDHVNASISFALRDYSQHLETLTLTGTGNINGSGNGLANTITGNGGNNVLNGAWGDDTLFGGAGDDRFTDENGNDRMTGGSGADTFVFLSGFGQDVITDFSMSQSGERIDLSAISSITSFNDLNNNHLSQSGSNTIINDGQGNTITLLGANMSDLAVDDFLF